MFLILHIYGFLNKWNEIFQSLNTQLHSLELSTNKRSAQRFVYHSKMYVTANLKRPSIYFIKTFVISIIDIIQCFMLIINPKLFSSIFSLSHSLTFFFALWFNYFFQLICIFAEKQSVLSISIKFENPKALLKLCTDQINTFR